MDRRELLKLAGLGALAAILPSPPARSESPPGLWANQYAYRPGFRIARVMWEDDLYIGSSEHRHFTDIHRK